MIVIGLFATLAFATDYASGSYGSYDSSFYGTEYASGSYDTASAASGTYTADTAMPEAAVAVDTAMPEAAAVMDPATDIAAGPMLCTAEQESIGCCSVGIFEYTPEWQLEAKNGGSWTTSPDSIRFDIADDVICGGTADKKQEGTASLEIDFPHDMQVHFEMKGKAESSFEKFELKIDGELKVKVQATDSEECKVSSCNMCTVSMPPTDYLITAGHHTFEVYVTTIDGMYHSGAFFEIDFTAEKQDYCASCFCAVQAAPADPNMNVVTEAPAPAERVDIFDLYDEDMSTTLTKSDLIDMSKHMHIWDEIVNGTGSLTPEDLEIHVQKYEEIWKAIVEIIQGLDYDGNGQVDVTDIDMIHEELEIAIADFNHWETEYKKAATSLGGKFGDFDTYDQAFNLTIDFDDLNSHIAEATDNYSKRLHGAFARISGSDDMHITQKELDENKEGIALLLAAFADLSNAGQDFISKSTYEDKLALLEGWVNDEEQVHTDALAQIQAGRRLFATLTTKSESSYDYEL